MPKVLKVLVVDDVPINLLLLEGILNRESYQVLTATNGPDARRLAEREEPDLILLDIMMPGEDGFATCQKLQANPRTAEIPIIFISAISDKETIVKGLTLGGWDYICKPFHMEETLARVRNYLRLSLAYKELIAEQAKRLQQIQDAQQAILVLPEEVPEAKFAVHYLPWLAAGGDFYDVFALSQDACGYFVSDISGHNLGTAFATSALKALVRQNSSQLYTPLETIRAINKILLTIFTDGQHLTAVYARLNRKKMTLKIINAAHPPAILISANGEPSFITSNSDLIGVFDDAQFEVTTVEVQPGDRLFLFTDGLFERFAEQTMDRREGLRRLAELCVASRGEPCATAVSQIAEAMFGAGRKPEDDVLLLGVDI